MSRRGDTGVQVQRGRAATGRRLEATRLTSSEHSRVGGWAEGEPWRNGGRRLGRVGGAGRLSSRAYAAASGTMEKGHADVEQAVIRWPEVWARGVATTSPWGLGGRARWISRRHDRTWSATSRDDVRPPDGARMEAGVTQRPGPRWWRTWGGRGGDGGCDGGGGPVGMEVAGGRGRRGCCLRRDAATTVGWVGEGDRKLALVPS